MAVKTWWLIHFRTSEPSQKYTDSARSALNGCSERGHLNSLGMPLHAPPSSARQSKPCHWTARRGQLIFLSPRSVSRCDLHVPAPLCGLVHTSAQHVPARACCVASSLSHNKDRPAGWYTGKIRHTPTGHVAYLLLQYMYRPGSQRQSNNFALLFLETRSNSFMADDHPRSAHQQTCLLVWY